MISNGKKPDWADVADRNEQINEHKRHNSKVPCCGHDFWEEAKKMDFGDVILCNRCGVYYAKIKHLPWVTKHYPWMATRAGKKPDSYGTNHLTGNWFVPVIARVTD